MSLTKQEMAGPAVPQRVFLPIGSTWLAILALLLEAVAVSSQVMGWAKVTSFQGRLPGPVPTATTRERIVVRVTNEMSGGEFDTGKAILCTALPALGLSFLLAVIALLLPHRDWKYIIVAFLLHFLWFVILFFCPRSW